MVAVLGLAVKETTTVNVYVLSPTNDPASIFRAALFEVRPNPALLSALVFAELLGSSFVQTTDQEYDRAFSDEHEAAWNINTSEVEKSGCKKHIFNGRGGNAKGR